MNVSAALKTQYHASLAMLKQTIDQCPEELWNDGSAGIAFWRVAYHTLFFTHLYLQPALEAFRPWQWHRDEYQFLGPIPFPPHRPPKIGEPYAKTDILDYWQLCDEMVDEAVDQLDLASPQSGFPWYNCSKLDHQIVNIRHVQHHAALLSGRLRSAIGADIAWIGVKS